MVDLIYHSRFIKEFQGFISQSTFFTGIFVGNIERNIIEKIWSCNKNQPKTRVVYFTMNKIVFIIFELNIG